MPASCQLCQLLLQLLLVSSKALNALQHKQQRMSTHHIVCLSTWLSTLVSNNATLHEQATCCAPSRSKPCTGVWANTQHVSLTTLREL